MKYWGVIFYLLLLLFSLVYAALSYHAVLVQNLQLEKVAYSRETEVIILNEQRNRWIKSFDDCEAKLKEVQDEMPNLPPPLRP